ncbi:MAG TPA: peptidylprolyl isomerase [Lacibacter sp.]|nr:peptidylprolyl isomerase [Lacibacter sp.]
MSIIQQIRERYAAVSIAVIALSLIGFILMDALSSRTSLFGGNTTTVGTVNGEKIDYIKFSTAVEQMEANYRNQGMQVNDEMRQQIIEMMWNNEIDETLLNKEYEKLGLTFSGNDINEALYGQNPPPVLAQQFKDPNTGAYDANAARQFINSVRKKKPTDEQRLFVEQLVDYLIKNGLRTKYSALLAGSTYYPKWMYEKEQNDQNSIASISYVAVPYASINDSSIQVTDADITNYINKHKKEYKQERSRTLSYVVFDAAPTAGDTAITRDAVLKQKQAFIDAPDAGQFVTANNSAITYFDGYVSKSKMQVPNADSIQNLPVGGVFGPYVDGTNFAIAKMVAKRQLPDSVKCRHILVGTTDNNGQPVSDSIAAARIDSIKNAVNGGASWADMVEKYNPQGDGSRQNKGEMTFSSVQIQDQNFAKEFAQFILFDGKTGERKVVKTSFGYHYIEIMEQKNFEPSFKIAYYSKPVEASEETINSASTAATQFASESRDAKSFEANARTKKLATRIAEVKPNDYTILGVGAARRLIKWAYENKVGDVSEPENIGDKYVVAMVAEEKEEGTPKAKDMRVQLEGIVRSQKKAEQIISKIGNNRDLEAIAKTFNTVVNRADSVSYAQSFIPGVGQEVKVTGAAFNPANKGKASEPIAGNSGVYVIRTESVGLRPGLQGDYTIRRMQMEQSQKGNAAYKYADALRKSATIKDNRIDFY